MKRTIILSAMLIAFALFFSCRKNENASGFGGGETPVRSSAKSQQAYGYALRVNTSFYTLEANTGAETDKTKWAASMALGEKVYTGKTRKATFTGDGKVYDFVEVKRDDKTEGLAFASQISEGGSLMVNVEKNARLYKSAKAVDVLGVVLPRGVVGAYFPETEKDGFVEIRVYDPDAQAYRQNFMRSSSISSRDADVQSSILLQTALPLKNEGTEKIRRDALLESAFNDFPDSVFNAEIQELINPGAAALKTEAAEKSSMQVNDANVNVRDIPQTGGKVIAQLNFDDEVSVSEQTVEESVIDGKSAKWYHINSPVEGWIFGAYLD